MVGSRLANKVAIVTGGASASAGAGMGRAIAEQFGQEGASVVVVDVATGGQTTADRINAEGGAAIFVQADVLHRGEVEKVVKTAIDRFGRIDILVNVVGGSARESGFLDVSDDMYEKIVDRNLKSVYLCCQVAIPRMIETGGGSIVHISSTNGLLGCPGLAVYSAVKSGFFGFSRVIATEFGSRGIRSNVICPGLMGDGGPDSRQPLGRTCVAADIASATLFLASDEASFITGQVLAVDGGHTTSYPEIF
ncbi:MAG TPA: SDR family oxidoreductase [Chloroflexota bacterium]|nr:SDR family oxidoreductase [Chloroflexota bacterium]